MFTLSRQQVRLFRLHAHHLDTWYSLQDALHIAGACGLQNSPPGAWEAALHNRIRDLERQDPARLLEEDKSLLQAWSFRGAPVVFPTRQSGSFLSALIPQPGEPFVYTQGIGLALDFLQLPFDWLLELLVQTMPRLKGVTLCGKAVLDQTLAGWMAPHLPADKRPLWEAPSMYGSPDRQTVGGAVVSFLLRPCSLMGLVVFGKRKGGQPTFTAPETWLGRPLPPAQDAALQLVRSYVHCYAPASVQGFASWLGCSLAQAKRLWSCAEGQLEPVLLDGRRRFVLSDDLEALLSPPPAARELHLLKGHDPYLGLFDREVILDDRAWQRRVWQTVSNPGVVLWQGEVCGIWTQRNKGPVMDVAVSLRRHLPREALEELLQRHALFSKARIGTLTIQE